MSKANLWRRSFVGVILVASLALAFPANAFLGGIVRSIGSAIGGDVGGAVNVVGGLLPGGGGPSDQVIGGVVGYPGQMLFGSAIKDFEGAASRSIDKLGATLTENVKQAGGMLSETLSKADVIVGKRLSDVDLMLKGNVELLDTTFAGTVSALDRALQDAVASLDATFDNTVGGLDIVLNVKTAASFEKVARSILLFGCVLVFLSFALWHVYEDMYKNKEIQRPVFKIVILAGILAILGFTASLLNFPNEKSVESLQQRYLTTYGDSLGVFDFKRAAHTASLLKTLNSDDPFFEGLHQKSLLMRDVLLRPASYNTALARSSLASGIDRTTRYLQRKDGAVDADMETLSVFVIAQSNPSRQGMMASANLAAAALKGNKGTYALYPLALHYLEGYLRLPIDDRAFEQIVGSSRNAYNKQVRQQMESSNNPYYFEYLSNEELATIAADARASLANYKATYGFGAGTGSLPVDAIIVPEQLTRDLYLSSIPLYVELIETSTRGFADGVNAEAKQSALARRKEIAKNIVNIFEQFSLHMQSPEFNGSAGRLLCLNGLHAIYSRAKLYSSSDVAIPPSDADMTTAIHLAWLSDQAMASVGANSKGPTSAAFFILRNMGSISFKRQEEALLAYENGLASLSKLARNDPAFPTASYAVAELAARIGLVSRKSPTGSLVVTATEIVAPVEKALPPDQVRTLYQTAFSAPGARIP